MKKYLSKTILIVIACSFILFTHAQHSGKVLETRKVKSTILNKEVRYTVYLPADYETSERTYPVVYLLHGFTDDKYRLVTIWRNKSLC